MKKLVLVLFVALRMAAEETYRLERIIVEGSRVSEHIVRAEARLIEEREYTEGDFREALYRIRRLPFVTDAAYRIEPGITARSTVLVIRILDETPVFYDAIFGKDNNDAALGGRLLLDDLGVVETRVQTVGTDDGGIVTLTYRGYGFGDRGIFVMSSLEQRFGDDYRTFDPAPSFTIGLPLTGAQTLTLSAARSRSRIVTTVDDDDEINVSDRTHVTSAALQWHYETFDDPLFATRGADVWAGPFWFESTFIDETYDPDEEEIVGVETTAGTLGFSIASRGWVPIGARNVVSFGVGADAYEDDSDTEYAANVRAALAHDFHTRSDRELRPWRARVEGGVGYRRGSLDDDVDHIGGDGAILGDVGVVMRHRWGTLRLTGSYIFR